MLAIFTLTNIAGSTNLLCMTNTTKTETAGVPFELSAGCDQCGAAVGVPCADLPAGEIHTVRYFALPLEQSLTEAR